MAQEIYYTSAPRGLQPGSRGFCTVAATPGISKAEIERLESLSGYRPLFPPFDARAALNPVAWSHLRVDVGGKSYSLLSRVGPAGLDYSERPNKFAHHVLLQAHERAPAGPAWMLRQPGMMAGGWDGAVSRLPAARPLPSGSAESPGYRPGKRSESDTRAAADLAEVFASEPERVAYLLYEPGREMLPLIDQALQSLPLGQRWDVTFTTYFTGEQGVRCLWRGVPADTPEAKAARQSPHALVLDLTARPREARPVRTHARLARRVIPDGECSHGRSPRRPRRGGRAGAAARGNPIFLRPAASARTGRGPCQGCPAALDRLFRRCVRGAAAVRGRRDCRVFQRPVALELRRRRRRTGRQTDYEATSSQAVDGGRAAGGEHGGT
jgi:hypothetical protein